MNVKEQMSVFVLVFFSLVGYSQSVVDGLDVNFAYTGDFAYNIRGGLKSDFAYLGNVDLIISFDTESAGLWKGGKFLAYGLNNHGNSISEFVGDLQGVSNIESENRTKLYQLWYKQKIGSFEFLIGQHDMNSVFAASEVAGNFINSSFGIQPDISSNIPVSIFPYASLGFLTRWTVNKKFTAMAGIYEGSPKGHHSDIFNWDPDKADGLVGVGEVHYKYFVDDKEKATFKLGMLVHNKLPEDAQHKNVFGFNSGIYFIADYNLYSESESDDEGLSCFTQLGYVLNDVDYVHSYGSFGLMYTGLFNSRDEDLLGLSFGTMFLNSGVVYPETKYAVQNESVIELFYEAEIFNHFTLQPDLQYIINPGSSYNLENALVVNLRAKVEI